LKLTNGPNEIYINSDYAIIGKVIFENKITKKNNMFDINSETRLLNSVYKVNGFGEYTIYIVIHRVDLKEASLKVPASKLALNLTDYKITISPSYIDPNSPSENGSLSTGVIVAIVLSIIFFSF
jgi:hypothetical protein